MGLARILAFLLFMQLALAAYQSPRDVGMISADMGIGGSVEYGISGSIDLSEISIRMRNVPQSNDLQNVFYKQSYEMTSDEHGNQGVLFTWKSPDDRKLDYSISAHISTNMDIEGIAQKNVGDAPEEIKKFLGESTLVTITPEIKSKAKEITKGARNDLEKAIAVIDWVHKNMQYDRTYEDSALTSAEVLKARRGVCKDYSHLAIALLRALGIPARYAAGYVFSGGEVSQKSAWDAHAWLEFWVGQWIPADSLFLEIGAVDGTHILFGRGLDQADLSDMLKERHYGTGNVINMNIEDRWYSLENLKYAGPENIFDVSLELTQGEVGLNTKTQVIANIKNPTKANLVASCILTTTNMTKVMDSKRIAVLDAGTEQGVAFELLSAEDIDDKEAMYKSPIEVECFPRGFAKTDILLNPKLPSGKIVRDYEFVNYALESDNITRGELLHIKVLLNNTGNMDVSGTIDIKGETFGTTEMFVLSAAAEKEILIGIEPNVLESGIYRGNISISALNKSTEKSFEFTYTKPIVKSKMQETKEKITETATDIREKVEEMKEEMPDSGNIITVAVGVIAIVAFLLILKRFFIR